MLYAASNHLLYDNAKWREQVRMLSKGGIRLHTATIDINDELWRSDGSLDMEGVENRVMDYLEMAPDVYLSVGINFARPPLWWREKHPQECIDYANGGRNMKETNVQGNFVAPSYASKVWLEDTENIITRIV